MIFYLFYHLLSISQGMRIFSPNGVIEGFFIIREDMKQSCGCGFVKLPNKDMAVAAIKALNRNYVSKNGGSSMKRRFFLGTVKNRSRAQCDFFPFERKITMADFGKSKDKSTACMWKKKGLCSRGVGWSSQEKEDNLRMRDFFYARVGLSYEVRIRKKEVVRGRKREN